MADQDHALGIGAVRRRMLHHPGQGALHLIGEHAELAVAVGDGGEVGHHHMGARIGEPFGGHRIVLGATTPPGPAMHKKHQHAAGLGAAVPIQGFIGVRAVGMALVQPARLQTRLHRLAEGRAGGQHLIGVGCVVDLVVSPIELGLAEFAPRCGGGDVHGIQGAKQSAGGQRFQGGGAGWGRL